MTDQEIIENFIAPILAMDRFPLREDLALPDLSSSGILATYRIVHYEERRILRMVYVDGPSDRLLNDHITL